MMPIAPQEWFPFSTDEQRLDYLKEHKLTPKTYKEPKPLFYSGIYAEGTEVCTAEGLVDENTLVIQVGEEYHCIHPDCLLEMQTGRKSAAATKRTAKPAAPQKTGGIDFVAIDFETATGNYNSACSLGVAVVRDLEVAETWYHTFQPPFNYYEEGNVRVHGITPADTLMEKPFDDFWTEISGFFDKNNLILAHNARFDTSVLRKSLKNEEQIPNFRYADTLNMVKFIPGRHGLDACCDYFGITLENHHNGLEDAIACAKVAIACVKAGGYSTFGEYMKREKLPTTSFHVTKKNNLYAKKAVKMSELAPTVEQFDMTHPLYQKRIAFTGDLTLERGAAMQLAVNKGAVVRSGVSAKTDILVIGRQNEVPGAPMNSKEKKARELTESGKASIRLMEEAEFMSLVKEDGIV